MRQGLKLMVLAGSAEARQIARAAQDQGADVAALVSEAPRGPNPMPVPCALHGFADVEGVVAALAGFDAVLDASHSFDKAMSRLGWAAAARLDLPFLSYRRPAWETGGSTGCLSAADVPAAVGMIARGARVFSATGWASLPDYKGFAGAALFLRQTTPHSRAAPFPFVTPVFGDPPFTQAMEEATFAKLKIDTLICRNLGGQASRPKVDAARALGVQVVLIDQPDLPTGAPAVRDVGAVHDWIATL